MAELGQLQKRIRQFRERGVEIFAICVDPPAVSERLRQKLGADMTFLSDEGLQLIDALNLRHEGAMPVTYRRQRGHDTALPTLLLVDRQGIIRWIYRPKIYRVRAQPDEIIRQVDRLRLAGLTGQRSES